MQDLSTSLMSARAEFELARLQQVYQEELRQKRKEIDQLEEHSAALACRAQLSSVENASLGRTNASLKSSLVAEKRLSDALRKEVEIAMAAIETRDADYVALEQRYMAVQKDRQRLRKALQAVAVELEELRAQRPEDAGDIGIPSRRPAGHSAPPSNLPGTPSPSAAPASTSDALVLLSEDRCRALTAQLTDAQGRIAVLTAQLEDANTAVSEAQGRIAVLTAQLEDANAAASAPTVPPAGTSLQPVSDDSALLATVESLRAANEELSERVSILASTVPVVDAERLEELNGLKAVVSAQKQQIHALQQELASAQGSHAAEDRAVEVDALKKVAEDRAVEVDALKKVAEDRAVEVDALQEHSAVREAQISSLQRELAARQPPQSCSNCVSLNNQLQQWTAILVNQNTALARSAREVYPPGDVSTSSASSSPADTFAAHLTQYIKLVDTISDLRDSSPKTPQAIASEDHVVDSIVRHILDDILQASAADASKGTSQRALLEVQIEELTQRNQHIDLISSYVESLDRALVDATSESVDCWAARNASADQLLLVSHLLENVCNLAESASAQERLPT